MASKSWLQRLRRKDEKDPTPPTGSMPVNKELPYGLTVFAEGIDPVLDIVAVHGLNGHRQETWTTNNVNWLQSQSLLPSDIPQARILSWGYDANTYSTSPISAQYLYDHARTLVSDLCLKRRLTETQKRPIIFVAHSLGGIVVKSALIHSDAARQGALEEHRSIKLSTYGIFFMGTPHQGGNGVHLGQLMLNIASMFMTADDKILKHLERDSEWLQQQLGQYGPISSDFVTKFAYEILPTPIVLGKSIMIVPKSSAVVPGAADAEPIAIHADHQQMVKFSSRGEAGYETVSGHLQIMAKDAPESVRMRWEKDDRIAKAQSSVEEDFSVPFSLAGIPETGLLVGRKDALATLTEAFQGSDSKRRTVLLQGLGGIGKTQVAVSFLKDRKRNYTAILWLNGRTEDKLRQSFAHMARRLYEEHPFSTLLRTAAETKDLDHTVAAMKRWLSLRKNTEWMLVFDNVDNPKLPGIRDPQAYDIRSYFPEADQGSILITTRSAGLKIGKMIPLKKLSDIQDSIAILAHMSERPLSDRDPHARNLASKLDGLPLALATAGAYLSQVSTSLEEYLRFYNDSWLRLQKTSPELLPYEDRTLHTTWDLSFKHIQSQNDSAGKLLRLWGYFDNQDLWFKLLTAGSNSAPIWFSRMVEDEVIFNEAIRVLCDHALIERLEFSDGYGMHSCVHAWTIHVLNGRENISLCTLALNCVGSTVPGHEVPEYWTIESRLLPHAQKCLALLSNGLETVSQLDQRSLDALHQLGNLYSDQGRMAEAEAMYLRALAGYRTMRGDGHPNTQMIQRNLDRCRRMQFSTDST